MAKFIKELMVVIVFITIAYGQRCCSPGEMMTEDKQCENVRTHEKTSISLTCPDRIYTDRDELDFFINSKVQLEFSLPNRRMTYDNFCTDKVLEGTTARIVAAICEEPKPVIDADVYGYCMGVSTFFLILTAGIYWHGNLHQNLFGKSIINLCVSLASGLLLLMLMRLMPYRDMNWCAVRGFSAYYFVLVSFFWMNGISLQILVDKKHGNDPEISEAVETKRYVWYVVYAWGVPAVLAAMTAIVNFMPGDHLKPGIGLNHCWFFDVSMQWEYMYSVMTALTVVNIIVFGVVISSICFGAQTHSEPFKQKLAKCMQLFVVMGIPWIFEMVGSLASQHLAWEIIDLFNALQGLWIFIVLVLLRTQAKPEQNTQYKDNITSSELPYVKLEK